MEELIACIARSLVKNPEAVTVTKIQKKRPRSLSASCRTRRYGKVIGKQGKIAKALRLVVKAAAVKANKKVISGYRN